MRNYIGGEGWRFECINGELCFLSNRVQWNYKLEELTIGNLADWMHTIFILHKSTGKTILKISIFNSFYWDDSSRWKVDIVEYNKLVTFFNKII